MQPNPEFAANPDARCACVLLLDTSSSMAGAPIDALNAGLHAFQVDLQEDRLASRRVEVAVVTFGGTVNRLADFVVAGDFVPPTLTANGGTPMGEAISTAIQMVKDRKAVYKSNGVPYYQPWIVLITDGEPTDEWQSMLRVVKDEMEAKALTLFAVGVQEANMSVLEAITPRAIKLDGLRFRDLFIWLSQSQRRVSANKIDAQTELPRVNFASPV